jgi:hypothetical protein
MKRWALAAALFLATGCATLEKKPPYLTGSWGGPHIAVTFSGALADVRFDCASGSIDALILAAEGGPFEEKGTYRAGPPGPIKVGQIFVSQLATYSGDVTKGVMTLNVELEDGTLLGPFTLTENAPPQLTRCL